MVADYCPPDTAAEVPTELVSVTETVPRALVLPVNVKGKVIENAPPLDTPVALAGSNHGVATLVSETVCEPPFSVVPEAAVKVKFALVRSRGVELASRNTWKPDDVTLVIFTEPGTMMGARRGTVIATLGAGDGSGTAWPVPATVKDASCTVMVPATRAQLHGGQGDRSGGVGRNRNGSRSGAPGHELHGGVSRAQAGRGGEREPVSSVQRHRVGRCPELTVGAGWSVMAVG